MDVQGAATIRKQAEGEPSLQRALVTVFLTPPQFSILEERLKRRGQDAPDTIRRRLAVARQEIQQWNQFEYLIISSSIEEDFRRMQAIVDAEKMRQSRAEPPDLESRES